MFKQATFFLAVCTLLCAAAVHADDKKVDPTGEWTWVADYGQGRINSTLTLKRDGDKLTGTYENDEAEYDLDAAQLKDDKLTCRFTLDANGQDVKIEMEGTLKGRDISGIITADVNGETHEFDWKAKRSLRGKDIVGKWQLKVVGDDGQTYTPTVEFEEQDGKLAGTFHSTTFGSHPLQRAATKANEVAFVTTVSVNGNDMKLTFTAEPKDEKLAGKVRYEIGGNTGNALFTAERAKAKSRD